MTLTMKSPDGDANFPGNVTATVTYALTRDNAIDINYEATTDKKDCYQYDQPLLFQLEWKPCQSGHRPYSLCKCRQHHSLLTAHS